MFDRPFCGKIVAMYVLKRKGDDTRTSGSYESLVRVHVVVAKQSSRESCVNDVIM